MTLLLQLGINGFSIGCTYAIIAMSFCLIYSTTKIFHVAHNIVFVSAAYLGLILVRNLNVNFYITLLVCALWSSLFGVLIYIFLYKPLLEKGSSLNVVFITSLAFAIVVENVLSLIFSPDPKQFGLSQLTSPIKYNGLILSNLDLINIGIAFFTFIFIFMLLNFTSKGKIILAVASNPELAKCKGIDINKTNILVFLIGSFLVASAGIFFGARGSLTPGMGSSLNLIAVMAVILGGIGDIKGAFISSLFFGIIRNVSLVFLDAAWLDTLTFSLFLLMIILKPTGLFGAKNKN